MTSPAVGKVVPRWIELSLATELADLTRGDTVREGGERGRSTVNRDADLRARFLAAGVEYVWVVFILGDESWSEPRRTRYQLEGGKLTVTGWRLDPGSTGEQFESWFSGRLRELLEGWKRLPKA
jgi:hypothetical protein